MVQKVRSLRDRVGESCKIVFLGGLYYSLVHILLL